MSTVKISQLQIFNTINANTGNTLFVGVDVPTDTSFQMTAHVLAQGLYSNEVLNVGNNAVTLPNTIAQFSLGSNNYIQTNLVNNQDGGSADHVITANTGNDTTYFIDLGYANKNFTPGSEFNSLGTSISPLDGYLYVQGSSGLPGGNLTIGTISTNTHINFIVGGGSASNVVVSMTSNSLVMNTQSFITFGDGTTQSTSAVSNAYSQAAFAKANLTSGGLNTANTNIQNAWNLANTALQNTANITVNSNLIVPNNLTTGNLTVNNIIVANTGQSFLNNTAFNGIISIANPYFNANVPLVKISAATNGATQPPANTDYILQLTGRDGYSARLINDSFGTGVFSLFSGRSGRGTATTPSVTQNGDVIARFAGSGYGTTGFNASGVAHMDVVATENFTDSARGSQIQFATTSNGSNVLSTIATFSGNTATFSGYVSPIKGFIYTPNIYPSSQTAITIDFVNNSVVRAQTATGLTATLSNLVTGKVVDVWITNTAGTNQNFVHGVSATNATINNTQYAIPGTSTIYVKYWSMDGTLANTFCAITHA